MKISRLAPFVFVSCVYGWGFDGHETVGFVAMQFLAPKALSFVKTSLGATYNESLGPAATWADEVKTEAAFKWSAPLHFVDAEDNPPTSCSVSESRDCGSGQCILPAIANFTTRVVDTSLSAEQRQEALKFLDHFLGDVGQPLHVEAKEVGGNDIDAICSGSKTNLHAAWDTGMINRLLSTKFSNSVTNWADSLATRIKTGDFQSLAESWITCSSTTTPASRRSLEEDIAGMLDTRAIIPLKCPLVWAQEANAFDCTVVFDFSTGEDLCTSSYFTQAVPVIELQIAKQGFRLAAWLNVLFDGATELP